MAKIEFVILMNVIALVRKISKPKNNNNNKTKKSNPFQKNSYTLLKLKQKIFGSETDSSCVHPRLVLLHFVEGNDASGVSLCNNNRTSECVNVYLTLVHPGMSSTRVTTVFSRATMSKYTEHWANQAAIRGGSPKRHQKFTTIYDIFWSAWHYCYVVVKWSVAKKQNKKTTVKKYIKKNPEISRERIFFKINKYIFIYLLKYVIYV